MTPLCHRQKYDKVCILMFVLALFSLATIILSRTIGLVEEKAHNGSVLSCIFTPDSTKILSTGTDGRMRLWDMISGINTMVCIKQFRV